MKVMTNPKMESETEGMEEDVMRLPGNHDSDDKNSNEDTSFKVQNDIDQDDINNTWGYIAYLLDKDGDLLRQELIRTDIRGNPKYRLDPESWNLHVDDKCLTKEMKEEITESINIFKLHGQRERDYFAQWKKKIDFANMSPTGSRTATVFSTLRSYLNECFSQNKIDLVKDRGYINFFSMINIRNLDIFNSENFEEFFDISMKNYKKKSSIENIRFHNDDFKGFMDMFNKLEEQDVEKWSSSNKEEKVLNEIQGIDIGLPPITRNINTIWEENLDVWFNLFGIKRNRNSEYKTIILDLNAPLESDEAIKCQEQIEKLRLMNAVVHPVTKTAKEAKEFQKMKDSAQTKLNELQADHKYIHGKLYDEWISKVGIEFDGTSKRVKGLYPNPPFKGRVYPGDVLKSVNGIAINTGGDELKKAILANIMNANSEIKLVFLKKKGRRGRRSGWRRRRAVERRRVYTKGILTPSEIEVKRLRVERAKLAAMKNGITPEQVSTKAAAASAEATSAAAASAEATSAAAAAASAEATSAAAHAARRGGSLKGGDVKPDRKKFVLYKNEFIENYAKSRLKLILTSKNIVDIFKTLAYEKYLSDLYNAINIKELIDIYRDRKIGNVEIWWANDGPSWLSELLKFEKYIKCKIEKIFYNHESNLNEVFPFKNIKLIKDSRTKYQQIINKISYPEYWKDMGIPNNVDTKKYIINNIKCVLSECYNYLPSYLEDIIKNTLLLPYYKEIKCEMAFPNFVEFKTSSKIKFNELPIGFPEKGGYYKFGSNGSIIIGLYFNDKSEISGLYFYNLSKVREDDIKFYKILNKFEGEELKDKLNDFFRSSKGWLNEKKETIILSKCGDINLGEEVSDGNKLTYDIEMDNPYDKPAYYFIGDRFKTPMLDIDYVVSEISDSGKDVVYDIENTSGYSYDQKKIVGTVTDTTVIENIALMRRKFRLDPDLAKQNISKIQSRYYKKQYNFNTIFDINLKPEDYEGQKKNDNCEKECPLKDKSAVELFIKFAGILVKLLEYYIPLLSKKPTAKQKEIDDYIDSMYIQHFEIRFRTFFENDNKGNENIKAKISEQMDNINKKLLNFFDEKSKLKYDTKYTANQGADPITILFTLCNIGIERLLEGVEDEDKYTMQDNPYKSKINPTGMDSMNFIDSDDGFNNSMIIDKLTSEKSIISSYISKLKGNESYFGFGKITRKKKGGANTIKKTTKAEKGKSNKKNSTFLGKVKNTVIPGSAVGFAVIKGLIAGVKGLESIPKPRGTKASDKDSREFFRGVYEQLWHGDASKVDRDYSGMTMDGSRRDFEPIIDVEPFLEPILQFLGLASIVPANPLTLFMFLVYAYKTLKLSKDVYVFLVNLYGIVRFDEIHNRKVRLNNKLRILLYGLNELNFYDEKLLENSRYRKGDPYTIDDNVVEKWDDELISLPGRLSMYKYHKFIVDSYSIDNTTNKLINVIVLEHKFKNPQMIYIPKKYNSFFENSYKSDVKVCIYENKYCKIFAHITEKLRPEVKTSLKNKIIRGTKRKIRYQKSKMIPGISTRVLNKSEAITHDWRSSKKGIPDRLTKSWNTTLRMGDKAWNRGEYSDYDLKHKENQNLLVKDIIKACNLRNKRNCNKQTDFIELYLRKHKINLEEDYGIKMGDLKDGIEAKLDRLTPKTIGGSLRNKQIGGKFLAKDHNKLKKKLIEKTKKELFYYDYTTEVESLYFYVNEHMFNHLDNKLDKKKTDYSVKSIPGFEFVRFNDIEKLIDERDINYYVKRVMDILKNAKINLNSSYSNFVNLNELNSKVKEKIEYHRDDLRDIVLPPLIDIPEIIKKDPEKSELWKLVQYSLDIYKDVNIPKEDALTFFEKKFRSLTEEERIDILKNINISTGSISEEMRFDTKVKEGVKEGVEKGVKAAKEVIKGGGEVEEVKVKAATKIQSAVRRNKGIDIANEEKARQEEKAKNDVLNKIAFLFDTCILVKDDKSDDWKVYDPRMYYITHNKPDFDRKYDNWMREVTSDIPKTYINIDIAGFYKDLRPNGELLIKKKKKYISSKKDDTSKANCENRGDIQTQARMDKSRYCEILEIIKQNMEKSNSNNTDRKQPC